MPTRRDVGAALAVFEKASPPLTPEDVLALGLCRLRTSSLGVGPLTKHTWLSATNRAITTLLRFDSARLVICRWFRLGWRGDGIYYSVRVVRGRLHLWSKALDRRNRSATDREETIRSLHGRAAALPISREEEGAAIKKAAKLYVAWARNAKSGPKLDRPLYMKPDDPDLIEELRSVLYLDPPKAGVFRRPDGTFGLDPRELKDALRSRGKARAFAPLQGVSEPLDQLARTSRPERLADSARITTAVCQLKNRFRDDPAASAALWRFDSGGRLSRREVAEIAGVSPDAVRSGEERTRQWIRAHYPDLEPRS